MNGLELSRAYYEQYGEPMLRERFPQLMPLLAAGLAGSGSECWGYDDEISRDHDFEPGFILFLPGEDVVDRRTEFMGVKRAMLAPVGGARHGVLRTADFFREKTGSVDGNLSLMEWLALPEYLLAEAVNGEIFADGLGEVTAIRDRLRHRPADVRLKKLAGQLLLMGQSGQYNYRRCLLHGETGAAQLAYQPYYKWSFRAMRALPRLSITAELLEYLLTTDNEEETASEKYAVMESVAADIIGELQAQGLTQAVCGDLEKHAYSVNDRISDAQIRNLHILAAV